VREKLKVTFEKRLSATISTPATGLNAFFPIGHGAEENTEKAAPRGESKQTTHQEKKADAGPLGEQGISIDRQGHQHKKGEDGKKIFFRKETYRPVGEIAI